ncbi:MAG TPA: hypothetical protein VLB83_05390, partial [Candidatus Paceibacterota bacterium]|nr:hypothetical protein [Candidatus Paceibacterota bacterium]
DQADPVALFHSMGIQECRLDAVVKFEGMRAVPLDPEDREIAHKFFLETLKVDTSAILYINTPVATKDLPGQPGLFLLTQTGDTYCALGIFASDNIPFFLAFQHKYQRRIQ